MESVVILRGHDAFNKGHGDGSGGYGVCSGYGDSYGDGVGSGCYGSGCYGSGSGYYGSGSGYGHGDYDYGSGSGSGHGSGDYDYGSGYGSGDYWQATIKHFSAKWTAAQQERLAALEKQGAKICFWRSNKDGTPANGGSSDPVQTGTVQREAGPLRLCSVGTLHGTLIPTKWKGSRWWIVALIGQVVGNDEKYGALEREILGEAL